MITEKISEADRNRQKYGTTKMTNEYYHKW